MAYSLSTLALCLLLSTTNGFGPPVIDREQRDVRSVFKKLRPTCATNSDTSEQNSSKIRQMSWFLTTQLLETALREASKGEDNSKISMDDIQKLADVLQRTEEEMLQPNAPISQLDEKAVVSEAKDSTNEVTVVDENDEIEMVRDQAQENNTYVEITDCRAEDRTSESDEAENESTEAPTQEESISKLNVDQPDASDYGSEKSAEEPKAGHSLNSEIVATVSQSEIETKDRNSSVEVEIESTYDSDTIKVTEMEGDTLRGDEAGTGSMLLGTARIPDVISTTFGRALEVVSSAVPPLRDFSIPKVTDETPSIRASQKENETSGEASQSSSTGESH